RRQFWSLIDDLAERGTTVLVTTHYLDEAERCDRIAIIHGGRLAALGTTAELEATFADRAIVEVVGPDPVGIMEHLDGLPEVETTSLFGGSVHAVLRERDMSSDVLRSALASAGVEVSDVRPVP